MQTNLISLIESLQSEFIVLDFTGLISASQKKVFQFVDFDKDVLGKTLQEIHPVNHYPESLLVPTLLIVDYACKLNSLQKQKEILFVKDHVNLSTLNPLIGSINQVGEPRFFPMNEVYLNPNELLNNPESKNSFQDFDSCTVIGLNPMAKPNIDEIEIMCKAKISHYCYNLVQASLMASHKGCKVLGLVVVENYN